MGNDSLPKTIFCIVFTVILGFYLLISIIYCLKRNQRVIAYWADYIILLSFLIAYFIMENFEVSSQINRAINLSVLSGLFIMNFLKGVFYIIRVNKLMNLPSNFKGNSELLINHFIKNGVMQYISKTHFVFLAIVFILQLIIVSVDIFRNYEDQCSYYNLILHACLLFLSLFTVFVVKSKYSKLINNQYFSNDLIIEKQFIKTKEQALCLIEHLINKNIFDIIINIPLIIDNYLCFSTNFQENYRIYYKIIYFIYVLFYGSFLLTIDKHNNVVIPKIMNYFYFYSAFSYNIMSSKKPIQLYEKNFNQSFEEAEFKNSRQNSFGIDPANSEIESEYYKTEKEFLPCNFFIIFKLLCLYFKKNEKIYLETEKSVEENGIPFRNFFKKETKPLLTSSNISDKILRISRISITNKERILTTAKFTMNNIMNSMIEKPLKDEFTKNILKADLPKTMLKDELIDDILKVSNENKLNDPDFKIEALFMDILFELFPFYQISINDVMKSLDIEENKELFRFFYEMKSKKKQFNSFYSKDLFLSFEIYDQQFLPFSTIKEFVGSYKKYLLDKMKSFSYSFLPLMIGIFNVTYLSYNKIVILYKNPLAFSSCVKYNCWINYCYNNANTKIIQKSAKVNEVADLEEIEVKNNIYLVEDDYNETIKTLKSDLKFLKSHYFDLNFFLNLFVLNDSKKNTNDFDLLLHNTNNDMNNIINKGKNDELIDVFSDDSVFRNSIDNVAKQLKKYFGSDVVSLIEKLYENNVVENRYVFKIYFSELFRKQSPSVNYEFSIDSIVKRNKNYCKS